MLKSQVPESSVPISIQPEQAEVSSPLWSLMVQVTPVKPHLHPPKTKWSMTVLHATSEDEEAIIPRTKN